MDVLSSIIVVIIQLYIHISNHYFVYFKLIQCYISINMKKQNSLTFYVKLYLKIYVCEQVARKFSFVNNYFILYPKQVEHSASRKLLAAEYMAEWIQFLSFFPSLGFAAYLFFSSQLTQNKIMLIITRSMSILEINLSILK